MHTLLITIFVATYVSVKLIAYAIVLPSLPKYKDKLSDRGKTHYNKVLENIIFVTFWSMFVFYEIMWQDKFLFEDSNLDDMIGTDGKLNSQDVQDLKIYADKYKDMHFAENIINIVTFGICIIVTLSFYFYLKKYH